jgi:hypothetical protein
MKKLLFAGVSAILISLMLLAAIAATAQKLEGAWQLDNGNNEPQTTRIMQDGYFMQTVYDKAGKKFVGTHGGVYKSAGGQLTENIEFDNGDPQKVGSSATMAFKLENDRLVVTRNGRQETWKRVDDGSGQLAGNWRITEREQNGKMNPMKRGPRKTLKILSGTRFQWAAINTDTKEFFGTGGGTYTFSNGKYTENIEFFSRDNSRVGASLSFDGKVEGPKWHHSGLSSKGDKIAEIWSREI